jgi:hypothetical protein
MKLSDILPVLIGGFLIWVLFMHPFALAIRAVVYLGGAS